VVSVRSLAGVKETTHFPLPNGLGDKAMGYESSPYAERS
jgi:hypothetical protein